MSTIDTRLDEILDPIYNYGWPGTGMPGTQQQMSYSEAKEAIKQLIQEAKGLEIKVEPLAVKHVMSKIKLKDETIAKRTLQPVWLITKWRNGTGEEWDYLIEIWVLKLLASLTHKWNWSIFLLGPKNIKALFNTTQETK